jgi:hypothetical protein
VVRAAPRLHEFDFGQLFPQGGWPALAHEPARETTPRVRWQAGVHLLSRHAVSSIALQCSLIFSAPPAHPSFMATSHKFHINVTQKVDLSGS